MEAVGSTETSVKSHYAARHRILDDVIVLRSMNRFSNMSLVTNQENMFLPQTHDYVTSRSCGI